MDDSNMEDYSYSDAPESYELHDTGVMGESTESETDILFRNLEEELRGLMRRYSVQPTDLEQLFQVVHQMFEIMDANQEALSIAHSEKQELENLWMQAKDELKHTKKDKANLQSLLEDEQMRHASEKVEYEKDKAVMETKIKQVEEYKHIVEQDLVKMKEKMNQNDQKRTEILELYKKQLDAGKTATLKRKGGTGTLRRRTLPRPVKFHAGAASVGGVLDNSLEASVISERFLSMTMSARADSLIESAEVPVQVTFPHDEQDEKEAQSMPHPPWITHSQPRPVNQSSLAEELRGEGEEITSSLAPGVRVNPYASVGSNSQAGQGSNDTAAMPANHVNPSAESGDEYLEEEFFEEELLAVDPQMITEVEMLQNEKEGWESEQKQLEEEKKKLREQKDEFERQNIELQVDLKQLKEHHKELQEKLTDVKKERDEILDNYLEQPFDEYCITRKELHKLLMEQQITKMELEKAKEEKYKLQQQLLSKRSIFEKFRLRLKRMLTKQNQQVPVEKKEMEPVEKKEMEPVPKSLPPPIPIVKDISLVIEKGYVVKRGWFMTHDSNVLEHKLPNWMGQITLKGIETERLECSAVARVYQSPMKGKSLNLKNHTPQQQVALLSSVQQLHVEVWTATVEGPSVRIEIIDIIARPPKVRQRFVMKPKTCHIVCMASIPGEVDPSMDFTDSVNTSQDLEETTKHYQPPNRRHSSYFGPRFSQKKNRPFSAPKESSTRSSGLMSSTPNLNLSSASDTGPLIRHEISSPELTRSAPPKKPPRRAVSKIADTSYKADSLSSSSCTMITIHEDTDGAASGRHSGSSSQGSNNEVTTGTPTEHKPGATTEHKLTEQKCKEEDAEEQDSKMEDDSSATLSLSSVEVEHEEPSKVIFSQSVMLEDRLGHSDDELGNYTDGRGGLRVHSFTSTPKRPGGLSAAGGGKFSESARYDGYLNDRREEQPQPIVSDEYDYDCTDGGPPTVSVSSPGNPSPPVMWIITEEQNLLFFPTTDPSHKPINRVMLRYQGLCMTYLPKIGEQRPRVLVGHARAKISIYCMDEFKQNFWDIDNPDEISLPSLNPNEVCDVKCIAHVKDRLWVAAGQSIFFLNAENPNIREGFIFLGKSRKSAESILSVGSVVVVTTKGSIFYVFDPDSAHELRRFDISTITRTLDLPTGESSSTGSGKPSATASSSTINIKTMVADSDFLYLGTSNGKIVSVPVSSLSQPSSTSWSDGSQENGKSEDSEARIGECSLESSQHLAVAVHRQMEGRVRTLLHINLPQAKLSKLKEAVEMLHYHSMPNLASPLGGRIPISPPILSFRSLIVSAGKGHVEYVCKEEKAGEEEEQENAEIHRERHEAFQLLVWGHKNTVS